MATKAPPPALPGDSLSAPNAAKSRDEWTKGLGSICVAGPVLAAAVLAGERAAAGHAAPSTRRELPRPAALPAWIHGRCCGMLRKLLNFYRAFEVSPDLVEQREFLSNTVLNKKIFIIRKIILDVLGCTRTLYEIAMQNMY